MTRGVIQESGVGPARGGHVSHGRSRSTRRRWDVSRPGSGWDRVGPPRPRPRAGRTRPAPSTLALAPTGTKECLVIAACRAMTRWRWRCGRLLPARTRVRPRKRRIGALDHEHPSAAPVAGRTPGASPPRRLRGVFPALAAGAFILGRASRLDAVSGSPCPARLPGGARCRTTGPPAASPARSSRTRAGPPQRPGARGG